MGALTEAIDRYWIEALQIDERRLHDGGVHFYVHHEGELAGPRAYLLNLSGTIHAVVPPALQSLVEPLRDEPSEQLLTETLWSRLLGDQLEAFLGPSHHHHRNAPLNSASKARALTADDAPAIAELRAAVPPADWAEGGMIDADLLRFGLFDGTELVAMAKLSKWQSTHADIGVVTSAQHRGKGCGLEVATAAATYALDTYGVARYRAKVWNTASLNIARRMGFERYGENHIVRLRTN